jgi:hypothetical protein
VPGLIDDVVGVAGLDRHLVVATPADEDAHRIGELPQRIVQQLDLVQVLVDRHDRMGLAVRRGRGDELPSGRPFAESSWTNVVSVSGLIESSRCGLSVPALVQASSAKRLEPFR